MLSLKNQPIPPRPIIITIYGEATVGKTSLALTSKNPLLLDFNNRDFHSPFQKSTFNISKWEDVLDKENSDYFDHYEVHRSC